MKYNAASPTTYFGRLTLASYLKISVFVGVTSGIVWAVLYGLMAIVRTLTGHTPPIDSDQTGMLRVLALTFLSSMVGSVLSALVGFPLYAWICKRRGGHVITGFMKELNRQPESEVYSSSGSPR